MQNQWVIKAVNLYNTIYPNYVRPYTGLNNGQIKKKADDEKNTQSSQQAENNNLHQIENNTQQESKGRSLLTNSYYKREKKWIQLLWLRVWAADLVA